MRKETYLENSFLTNADIDHLIYACKNKVVFEEFFELITIEYSDGFKMDCDADKWLSSGHTIMSTCKDLKVTAKLKK